jgi:hypothetical protein
MKMSTCHWHPRATNAINHQLSPKFQRQSLSKPPQQPLQQLNKVSIFFQRSVLLINRLYLVRRKPAPDDKEDDVINVDVSSHRTTSNNAHQNVSSTGSSEHEGDGGEDAEDELSEGDKDLSGLNGASLQKKISSEVKSPVFLFVCIIEAKYIVI